MSIRKQYLNKEITFQEYYGGILKECGITFKHAEILPKLVRAYQEGDTSFNDCTKLSYWDCMPLQGRGITEAFKARGDWLTLAGKVCLLKESARIAVLEAINKHSSE